jgi:hypothetical protein
MRPAALIACLLALLATTEVVAQETCRNFSWSIGRPINLFDEPIEVEAKSNPPILQIGGAGVRHLNIAVVRIRPFEWRC